MSGQAEPLELWGRIRESHPPDPRLESIPDAELCREVSELVGPEAFAKAIRCRGRDTVVAVSLIFEMGRQADGRLTILGLGEVLRDVFQELPADFAANPVDCILGFGYALDRADEFRSVLRNYGLTLRPSEVFSLTYDRYPELDRFHVPPGLKRTVDRAYTIHLPPAPIESATIHIVSDTARQWMERRRPGPWIGDINWLGVRPWRACPQKCVYCDIEENRALVPPELLLPRIGHLIREVTHDGRRRGVILSISGGEPTLFPGPDHVLASLERRRRLGSLLQPGDVTALIPLILYARQMGMQVSMNTTLVPVGRSRGKGARRGDLIAERLVACGLDRINVSLESCDPKRHDATTRLPGSWERTRLGIRRIEKHGKRLGRRIQVAINTVLTRQNFRDLPDLVRHVGEGLSGVADVNPLPVKGAENRTLFLGPADIAEYDRDIVPRLLDLAEEYGFGLLATKCRHLFGRNPEEILRSSQGIYHAWARGVPCYTSGVSAYVDYAGRISPCSYNADAKLPEFELGSILEVPARSLREIRNRHREMLSRLPEGELCRSHCGVDMCRVNGLIHDAVHPLDCKVHQANSG
jgi:MoaA/NifB/PqqE/SkfB family radical SAM enzyme